MEECITLEKELLIRNINKVWDDIFPRLRNASDNESTVNINMKQVESVDGAGLQLIIYLLSLSIKFPQKYRINNLSDKISRMSETFGFSIEKSEV